jgi:hypothetical protein
MQYFRSLITRLVTQNVVRFKPLHPGWVRPFPKISLDYVDLDQIMQQQDNRRFVDSLRKYVGFCFPTQYTSHGSRSFRSFKDATTVTKT